jgi:hypothetical protein
MGIPLKKLVKFTNAETLGKWNIYNLSIFFLYISRIEQNHNERDWPNYYPSNRFQLNPWRDMKAHEAKSELRNPSGNVKNSLEFVTSVSSHFHLPVQQSTAPIV